VEGLLGLGKSKLLTAMSEIDMDHVQIYHEPVEQFNTYKDMHPLDLMYTDPNLHGSFSQYHIIQTLEEYFLDILLNKVTPKTEILLIERSLFSPMAFTTAMYRMGYLTDFEYTYLTDISSKSIIKLNEKGLPILHKIFNIDGSIGQAIENITKRDRSNEKNFSEMETYLGYLKEDYDAFFHNFVSVNGNHCLKNATYKNTEDLVLELEMFMETF
jgi:deoxyadenosine/deoxycytidine kinase